MSSIKYSAFNIFSKYLSKGHERSINAKKNIFALFIIKGLSIAISLVIVPLTINYINPSRYGIWLTISSIVAWFSFFDIGLTQGLRNKFAIAKANNDDSMIQVYVSTTYALLTLIFFGVWLIFIITNQFINWASILNVPIEMRSEVTQLAVIVFSYFCIDFILRIITTLLTADQQPAKSSLVDLAGQIFSLLLVVFLVKTTEGSLIKLGIALCLSPLIVLLITNFYLFKSKFKKYRPVISKVKFSVSKQLFNIGMVFFVIQVAAVIQYQTANIVIAHNFNTEQVTSYNIVYKYFGVLNMIFAIFLSPFWSASTEAFHKNDIQWIKNSMKRYGQVNLGLFFMGIIMLFFSETVYRLWLGEGVVQIGFALSFWGFMYFNVYIFGGKYVHFLNGINALRIQFISGIFSPVLYIILALLFIKYLHLGVYSLFLASLLANFNGFLLAPLQYHKIINQKKKRYLD
jgi:O-antigen/teichoic acid export membrane protein